MVATFADAIDVLFNLEMVFEGRLASDWLHDQTPGQSRRPTNAQVLADIEYEIEPAGEVVASVRYPHQ